MASRCSTDPDLFFVPDDSVGGTPITGGTLPSWTVSWIEGMGSVGMTFVCGKFALETE
jgi:hypothetical protein